MTLVPIPWQPRLYLTPSTLELLDRASTYYGDDLYLYDADYRRISPAWRSYAQQATAYRNWRNGTGPLASSPDSGQRNHMRGAAFDLRLTTARVQQACRRAGLIRDTAEPWHWNDPDWPYMPIIKTRTATASGTITPLTPRSFDVATVYYNTDTQVKGKTVDGKTMFALAGDSPGTDANWLQSSSLAIARSWVKAHGGANVPLNSVAFERFRTLYLQPVRTTT